MKIVIVSLALASLFACGQSKDGDSTVSADTSALSTQDANDIPFLGSYAGRSGFFSEKCTVVVERVKPSSGYEYISVEATRDNKPIKAQRRYVDTLNDVKNGVTPMNFNFSTGGDLLSGSTAKVSLSWTKDGMNDLSISLSTVLFGVISEQSSIDCKNLKRI